MTNSLVNFLVTLKNASNLKHEFILVKFSFSHLQIVESLYLEGFIQSYKVKENSLYLKLRYFFNKSILKNLKLVSTPSNFRFLNLKNLSRLSNKNSTVFISTSRGVLTLSQCKSLKLGGKVLFIIN
jgi:small subunit ribosomal protein S8